MLLNIDNIAYYGCHIPDNNLSLISNRKRATAPNKDDGSFYILSAEGYSTLAPATV